MPLKLLQLCTKSQQAFESEKHESTPNLIVLIVVDHVMPITDNKGHLKASSI